MTTYLPKRVATAVLIAAAAGTLLAGCKTATSAAPIGHPAKPGTAAAAPAAAGKAPDVCSLITEADATTAIGKDAGPGVHGGTADAPQCSYGDGALIVVMDQRGKAEYDSNHDAMAGGGGQDISGIGDGAFEVSGGPTALVYFYKGSTLVEIMLQGNLQDGLKAPADAAIAVARAAAVNA
ncbi:MAG TPA: hypothetical protein VGF84_05975 [Micromonosporaceae bacterium]|jgi:hypothetical protein